MLVLTRNALFLAAVVGAACWMSLTFTRKEGGLSTLWIAGGILCGVLLSARRSHWVVYLVVAFAANVWPRLAHDIALLPAVILAAAGTFEAWFVAYCVMRFAGSATNPEKIELIGKVATTSTVAGCAAAAVVAAGTLTLQGNGAFIPLFATWLSAHVVGMVVFATLTVVGGAQGIRLLGRPETRFELVLTVLLVAATAFGVFTQTRQPLLFLVFPALLLAAFRHGFSGVVLGVTVTSLIAMVGTFSGHGPLLINPDVSAGERTFVLQLFIASMCLLTFPVAIALTRRRWLERRLSSSESEYRMLAEYSRDLVVRIDWEGNRKFISPSATEILGWDLDQLREERWDLIHPDDRSPLMVAMSKLRVEGGSATVAYRVQHSKGHYVWIEAHARLVPSSDHGVPPDIIYAGRDISRRVKAEQDLARNQRRLRAIADNTPAFIIHINTEERYTFANIYVGQTLGIHPAALIGRSLRDVTTEKIYAEIKPHIDAALRGETVTYDSERMYAGERRFFQCTYIPDRAPDGEVVGFYGMVFDVTNLKDAERQLAQLARHDALTGLANRLQFNERVALAAARRHRSPAPIALLYLDIDHFKQINDTMGHAVGDAILVAFAERLRACVRETDLVARLGGDEFVVLVEDLDSSAVAQSIAQKLVENLADGIAVEGRTIAVTTSIGIAYRDGAIASSDELIKLADDALYSAKAAGRNTYKIAG